MAKAKTKVAHQVAHWGEIDPAVFAEFERRVEQLRDELIPRDGDDDRPIKVIIVNKMTHELSAVPVPNNEIYSYEKHGYLEFHPDKQRELDDEHERWLSYNLEVASKAVTSYLELRSRKFSTERDARKPLPERIRETCLDCRKGVGLMAPDIPDYPSAFHTNGCRCFAYQLRLQQLRGAPKEVEPRYCRNPECRARLRSDDSRKGVNDKDICINPQCGIDNSKAIWFPRTKRGGKDA